MVGNRFKDLTGQRFGRLIAEERIGSAVSAKHAIWSCRCDCGGQNQATSTNLRRGLVTSCGCRRFEVSRDLMTTHGQYQTPEHNAWRSMMCRCYTTSQGRWASVGGRGIRVCDEWKKFEGFIADLGPRPGPKYQLTRLDKDDHFAPGNVVWQERTRKRAATAGCR